MKNAARVAGVMIGVAICGYWLLSTRTSTKVQDGPCLESPEPVVEYSPVPSPAATSLAEETPRTARSRVGEDQILERPLDGIAIRRSEGGSAGEGLLLAPASVDGPSKFPIVGGIHRFDAEGAPGWMDASWLPGDFLFMPKDGLPTTPVGISVDSMEDGKYLVFTIPAPVTMEVVALDLQDAPIPGARISVGLPAVLSDSSGTAVTGENGAATLTCFGLLSTARIRAEAPGYGMSTTAVVLEQEHVRVTLRLGRILAAGVVFDRRDSGLTIVGRLVGDGKISPRMVDWLPFLEARRSEWSLGAYDRVDWTVLQERTVWQDAAVWKFAARHYYTGALEEFVVPMRHVLDPELRPVRIAASGIPYAGPVRFEIGPASAFHALPPESLLLRFVPLGSEDLPSVPFDSNQRGKSILGDRVSGTTYEFWVPPGEYRVETDSAPFDDVLAEYPRIIPLESVWIGEGAFPELHPVSLVDGEAFIGYQFVNPQGLQIDFPGLLYSQLPTAKGKVHPSSGLTPRYRFIRPGAYSVVAMDSLKRNTSVLSSEIRWPGAVSEAGLLSVVIADTASAECASRYQ